MKKIKLYSLLSVSSLLFFLSQPAIAQTPPQLEWSTNISSSDSNYNHCYSSANVSEGSLTLAGYSDTENCAGVSRSEINVENISQLSFGWSYYVERDANISVTVSTYEGDLFNITKNGGSDFNYETVIDLPAGYTGPLYFYVDVSAWDNGYGEAKIEQIAFQ
ncbi:hypothetical protein ASG89_18585 [Paenibacillus sp. Soil766]|uniref:hypothetical protein n=1 Tax=Paenibacillus sp. Soil766 TaxID=1736404 RepID=UPI0007095F92|nr:hypothetical protein [Paenibacillus sp. Soil766]KRF06854.1 hypothetical protein ASG89_18585 [Paenibacillus sp. Soil766]